MKPRIATNNFAALAYALAYALANAPVIANALANATVIAIKMEVRQMFSLGGRLTVGPTPTVDFIGARSTLRALFTSDRSIGCGSCRTSLVVLQYSENELRSRASVAGSLPVAQVFSQQRTREVRA